MVKAQILTRLGRLEAAKAKVESVRFFLNFAGRDAVAVVDFSGRVWTREDGESPGAFDARIQAGHPPHGFICLGPA